MEFFGQGVAGIGVAVDAVAVLVNVTLATVSVVADAEVAVFVADLIVSLHISLLSTLSVIQIAGMVVVWVHRMLSGARRMSVLRKSVCSGRGAAQTGLFY